MNFFIKIFFFKKFITKILFINFNEVYVYIDNKVLYNIVEVLISSILFDVNSFIDIVCVDWLSNKHRFSLYYNFISYIYNYRIFLVLNLNINILYPYGKGIKSLTNLFLSANWLEREIWDCFGVYYYGHCDLRRILTDYGFTGFPFRKDYPLIGYKEVRYDDINKLIIYENVKLAQNYRVFSFVNPWY